MQNNTSAATQSGQKPSSFHPLLSTLYSLLVGLAGPLPLKGTGQLPAQGFDARWILAICAVSLLWFILDHIGWGILDYLEGETERETERLHTLVQDAMPHALLVELLPLPSSLVVALVYTYLSWPAFALMSVATIAVAMLAQHWADTRNKLVQRAAELAQAIDDTVTGFVAGAPQHDDFTLVVAKRCSE